MLRKTDSRSIQSVSFTKDLRYQRGMGDRILEKGIKNADVRLENKKRLLKLLYWNGGVSKQEITDSLHLSMPTVNLLISQLEEDSLIDKRRADTSSGGRIPDLIYFRYASKLVVGVEVRINTCIILITDLQGVPQARKQVNARFNNGGTYWQGLRALILQMIEENRFDRKDILGVGIALQNSMENCRLIEPIKRYDYDRLGLILGFPTLLEWEANAAGFANIWFEKEMRQAIFLSVSEDVSGAILVDHRMLRGERDRCGRFGHMTLVPDGDLCTCGKKGCVQAYCSTDVLTSAVNDDLGVFFSLREESEALSKLWKKYCKDLGSFIANLNMALDMPVIIGGDLGMYMEKFDKELIWSILECSPQCDPRPIRSARVKADAAAVGVSLMISARYLNLTERD